MRIPLGLLAALAALALAAAPAAAGPPAHFCRGLSARQCEEALGPYAATTFLDEQVLGELRQRGVMTSAAGLASGCGPTPHHTRRLYRCTVTVGPGSPSRCIVEALLYERRGAGFDVRWRKESAGCRAPAHAAAAAPPGAESPVAPLAGLAWRA